MTRAVAAVALLLADRDPAIDPDSLGPPPTAV
jgi:hypothetical protein